MPISGNHHPHAWGRGPLRLATLAAALSFALPVHAQFGALFQSLMSAPPPKPAPVVDAKPAKKWGQTQPVPADVQAAASAFADKPGVAELKPLFERLFVEGERNATLNLERIGLAALYLGRMDVAEKALDAAALRIDQIYADNPEAQKAKSLWSAEKVKDFKGEPYERAMAFFYRGLVYAARNDFQNARAMFKQADYQDTVAEAEQYAGDFGLMPYMAGWASHCDGNAALAADFQQMAAKGDKNYAQIPATPPVLVLFESGRAPFKYGAGKFGEALKWQAHDAVAPAAKSACVSGDGDCFATQFVVGADVGFQATTRGGRPIDGVLGGKASFKEGAQTVAGVAGAIGNVGLQTAMLTGNRDAAGLGMLGMFAGLVAQGVSASTQAQADIREWEQLPGTVWLATVNNRQKEQAASAVVETDASPDTPKPTVTRLVNTPSCQLYWGRDSSPLNVLREAGPVEPSNHKRDPAFRQEIEALFVG